MACTQRTGSEGLTGPREPSRSQQPQQTTGVRPWSAPPSYDGHIFPQGKKKQNMFLGLFHNIFSLYNVLYLKNKK